MITNVRIVTNATTGRTTTYFNIGKQALGIDGDHSSGEALKALWTDFSTGKLEQSVAFAPTERTISKGERAGQTFIAPMTIMLQPKLSEQAQQLIAAMQKNALNSIAEHQLNVEEGTVAERVSVGEEQLALINALKETRKAARMAALAQAEAQKANAPEAGISA